MSTKNDPDVAATCLGVRVPASPFLHEQRIERINAARYEGQEIEGALRVTGPEDRVLELGAGLGIVGAVVAHNAGPRKITSFEANPNLIPHIQTLYSMNGLNGRISVRNQVLVSAPDRPATMKFHVRSSYLGSSLADTSGRAVEVVDVETASFADVMAELTPTVLLMDIEGGELEILRHAELTGLRAMVLEFHPGAYGREGMMECKAIIEKAGFRKIDDVSTRTVWSCTREI